MNTKSITNCDVAIVGSGMGSLSAACLLAKEGKRVVVLEQNYIPGGCTTSYWRKGFVFEAGATTIVGLNDTMPLKYLLDELKIDVPFRKLALPMQVYLSSGEVINKYQGMEDWIAESIRVFGQAAAQRVFWEECFDISKEVWRTSTQQLNFPPTTVKDLFQLMKHFSWKQVKSLPYAFKSMANRLKELNLDKNDAFIRFIDEQLMITSQNTIHETNMLFGATALCYTNYDNYYVDGGLYNLVTPLVNYIEGNKGVLMLRCGVDCIKKKEGKYYLNTNKGMITSEFLISGIPLNNTLEILDFDFNKRLSDKTFESTRLNSAFQMGIAFKPHREFDALHHQLHTGEALSGLDSGSVFLSLSHPEDTLRSDTPGIVVASVSTHLPNPESSFIDKELVEEQVLTFLENKGFLKRDNIIYYHSSTQKSWEKWTKRKYGAVGGYPQFQKVKPWMMPHARLDGHKAYLCGDTTYPGQGIPGVVLSAIIAVQKLNTDWK